MPKVIDLDEYPYLSRVKRLQYDYPALKSFLDKLLNTKDEGRVVMEEEFRRRDRRTPGRCCVLEYGDTDVNPIEFKSAEDVQNYLLKTPATGQPQRRLFVLEDLELEYVEVLGHFLGVDPLVFAEQMNTWNYCDVHSIAHRPLPSLTRPDKSFTTRYYELRTLPPDHEGLKVLGCYMTFAVNRRLYQPWRDIDGPSIKSDRRVRFIRRYYSFWTSATLNKDTTWNCKPRLEARADSADSLSSTSGRPTN